MEFTENGIRFRINGFSPFVFSAEAAGNSGSFTPPGSGVGMGSKITMHPQSSAVRVGEKAAFTVAIAGGTGNDIYQWYVNRNDGEGWMPVGANNPVYTTSAAALENNGYQYKCVVSDGMVTHESNIATLTVSEDVEIPTTGDHSSPALQLCLLLCLAVRIILTELQKQKNR